MTTLSVHERVRICTRQLEAPITDASKPFGWRIVTTAVCMTAAAMLAGALQAGHMNEREVRGLISKIERVAFLPPAPPGADVPIVPQRRFVWARAASLLLLSVLLLLGCN